MIVTLPVHFTTMSILRQTSLYQYSINQPMLSVCLFNYIVNDNKKYNLAINTTADDISTFSHYVISSYHKRKYIHYSEAGYTSHPFPVWKLSIQYLEGCYKKRDRFKIELVCHFL